MNYMWGRLKYLFNIMNFGQIKQKQKTFFIYTVVQNSQNNTVKINNHDFSFCLLQDDEFPTVLVSLFFEQPTPFAEDFLERIANLKYPKSRIDLFIHNKVSC